MLKWFIVWVALGSNGNSVVTVDEHPFYNYGACKLEQETITREQKLAPGVRVFCGGNMAALAALTRKVSEEERREHLPR